MNNENNLKIFIILPYLTNIGGAGRYGWELAEYLASKGDQIHIISLYTDKSLYKSDKINVIDLADKSSFTQSMKFWLSLSKIRNQILQLVKKEKPDLVFFNHFPSTLWVSDYGDIPTLCYPQDVDLLYSDTYTKNLSSFKRLIWKIFRIIIRKYDKIKWKKFDEIICNSNFSASTIGKKYHVFPKVVYPGTNTDFFTPSTKNPNDKIIMLIGDHKARRVNFFLNSVPLLLKKHDDFKIWIVGSHGSYAQELKNMVEQLHIEKFVTFFGKVSDEKLKELYSKALIFVHLQKIHPFGLVFTEAMSCETAVIGCKPGATEEVIDDNNTGFLINENSPDELVSKIQILLDEPQKAVMMGKNGRKRVKQKFELSIQYNKIRELMESHIKSKI